MTISTLDTHAEVPDCITIPVIAGMMRPITSSRVLDGRTGQGMRPEDLSWNRYPFCDNLATLLGEVGEKNEALVDKTRADFRDSLIATNALVHLSQGGNVAMLNQCDQPGRHSSVEVSEHFHTIRAGHELEKNKFPSMSTVTNTTMVSIHVPEPCLSSLTQSRP